MEPRRCLPVSRDSRVLRFCIQDNRAGFLTLSLIETMKHDPRDFEIRIQYSAVPGDECYIARVVEWPTISAHGDTPEEAARQIQLALGGAVEVAGETGFPVPQPASLAKA